MNQVWTMNRNCEILFGEGARLKTADKLKEYGASNILLLYDMAMKQFDYKEELVEIIRKADIKVITYQVEEGEPTVSKIDWVYREIRETDIDAIVGIGGGSTMDTGKMVGKLIANGGCTVDYLNRVTPEAKIFQPIITIPSTAGTGAEVTPYLTCSMEDGKKGGAGSTPVTCAIVDPVLTYGLPTVVTANTGIDALCHAAEVLCNFTKIQNEYADTLSKEAIRIIFEWLPKVYENSADKEARKWMSYAALLGGLALTQRGIFIGHPIADVVADSFHLPHGAGCSIGMNVFVHYNMTEDPAWIIENAKILRIEYSEIAYDTVASQVAQRYETLCKNCGMKTLRELGAKEDYLDEIKKEVMRNRNLTYYPVKVKENALRRALYEVYKL